MSVQSDSVRSRTQPFWRPSVSPLSGEVLGSFSYLCTRFFFPFRSGELVSNSYNRPSGSNRHNESVLFSPKMIHRKRHTSQTSNVTNALSRIACLCLSWMFNNIISARVPHDTTFLVTTILFHLPMHRYLILALFLSLYFQLTHIGTEILFISMRM